MVNPLEVGRIAAIVASIVLPSFVIATFVLDSQWRKQYFVTKVLIFLARYEFE